MIFTITCIRNNAPITLLQDALKKIAVKYKIGSFGEVVFDDFMNTEDFELIKKHLANYSIAFVEDEKEQIFECTKNILRNIAYDERRPKLTLSKFLEQELNLSYGYISFIFSPRTLTSIEHYMILLRIDRAKSLIVQDLLTIKEIAATLHYSSVSHFSRQFKQATGMKISTFRQVVERKRGQPLAFNYKENQNGNF